MKKSQRFSPRFAPPIRRRLLRLRELVFETAAAIPEVGPIEETLRWGDPSYLTSRTRSGSLIRMNALRRSEREYALYFHCGTDLVSTFRSLFASAFRFDGNRALVFDVDDDLPEAELRHCIAMALAYHADRRLRGRTTLRQGARARAR